MFAFIGEIILYDPKQIDIEKLKKWKMSDGYIRTNTPPGHPSKCKTIMVHRLVMEKVVGRVLTDEETVHHKNENKSDWSEGNLQLFESRGAHQVTCHAKYPMLWAGGWLKKEYVEKGKAITQIANELGCDHTLIMFALDKLAIKKRAYTLTDAALEARKKGALLGGRKPYISFGNADPEWARTEYLVKKRSLRDIGIELKWHKNKVKRFLVELGIELRTETEQRRLHIAKVNSK